MNWLCNWCFSLIQEGGKGGGLGRRAKKMRKCWILTLICVISCKIQWRVDPALMQVKSVASDLPVLPKYLGQIWGTYQASSFWFSQFFQLSASRTEIRQISYPWLAFYLFSITFFHEITGYDKIYRPEVSFAALFVALLTQPTNPVRT